MTFGGGGAWIEVFGDEFLVHVWAPFEKTLLQCFHEGGDFWVAQRLMCKFYGIGSRSYRVRESRDLYRLWVFLIAEVFSHGRLVGDGVSCNREDPKICLGVFVAS